MRGMVGERALITGASSGIGYVAARELARMGADVVMLVRSPERGEEARNSIAEETGSERIELLVADLADLSSVCSAAEEYVRRHDRLDVLIANAGAIYPQRRITSHGNEMTFQVNHLAHFLLCSILEPQLCASAPARVVTVSSDAHYAAWRGIRFGDLTFERGWRPFSVYAHSKLANIMFCHEHARRMKGTGVTSTVMHPGRVKSGFGSEGYGLLGGIVGRASELIARAPEQGADTIVWLASSTEVDGASGAYFFKRRPHRSSPVSLNKEAQHRLWEVSEELTRVCG